ncbi:MAG TPA: ATP-binding protein [Acidimicrobiales bacterium]|nr:ATP-binding protein [Acidimicrobiales bacterium]
MTACHLSTLEDDALLCTSEVVTNVVLHTSSRRMGLTVICSRDSARVEVYDDSQQLPHVGVSSRTAQNGRGLLLVDALSADWGAAPSGYGKTVWFVVSPNRSPVHERTADDILDQWADDSMFAPATGAPVPTTQVVVANLATAAFLQAKDQVEDLARELVVAAVNPTVETITDGPERAGAHLQQLLSDLAGLRYSARAQAARAVAQGQANFDLVLQVEPALREVLEDYRATLEWAYHHCDAGAVLAACLPQELRAVHRAYLDSVISQLR